VAQGYVDGIVSRMDKALEGILDCLASPLPSFQSTLEGELAERLRDARRSVAEGDWQSTSSRSTSDYRRFLHLGNAVLDTVAVCELARREGVHKARGNPWQAFRKLASSDADFVVPVRTADFRLRARRNMVAEHRRPGEMQVALGEGPSFRVDSAHTYDLDDQVGPRGTPYRAAEDQAIVNLARALRVAEPTRDELSAFDPDLIFRWVQMAEDTAIGAPAPEYERIHKELQDIYKYASLRGCTLEDGSGAYMDLVGLHLAALRRCGAD
jgi:hypothetical protein